VVVLIVIVAGVGACVTGALVVTWWRGDDVGGTGFILLASTVFVTGLSLGGLLTAFSSPTRDTWWWALTGRVTWTIGGAALMDVAIFSAAFASTHRKIWFWILLGCLPALGGVACASAVFDLVRGPVTLRGVPALDVTRFHRARGSDGIEATLELVDEKGALTSLDFAGWGANEAQRKIDGCPPDRNLRIQVLRHVQRVLDVVCE
jgi:hypothetical protein